jgi:hypothetical protein
LGQVSEQLIDNARRDGCSPTVHEIHYFGHAPNLSQSLKYAKDKKWGVVTRKELKTLKR